MLPFCYLLPMRKALNMTSARILNCLARVRDAFLTNAVRDLISGKVTWVCIGYNRLQTHLKIRKEKSKSGVKLNRKGCFVHSCALSGFTLYHILT